MVSRFLSFVAWALVLLALLLTAPPVAGAQGNLGAGSPGPNGPGQDGPAGVPQSSTTRPPTTTTPPGPVTDNGFTFPPEWNPSKPDVIYVDSSEGIVMNLETEAVYDALFQVVIHADGRMIDHATGDLIDTLAGYQPPPPFDMAAGGDTDFDAVDPAANDSSAAVATTTTVDVTPPSDDETDMASAPAEASSQGEEANDEPSSEPAPAAEREVAPADGAAAADTEGLDTVLYPALGISAASLLVAAFIALRRGRRAEQASMPKPDLAHDEAMATNQLLAGAKDEADIIRILDRAAERQVKAGVTLFHVTDDGLQRAGDDGPLPHSDLQRVVDTGQKVKTILTADQAFDGVDQAVLALPVIHGGRVQAVLTAHRSADHPFKDSDFGSLEPIGPALGGALERTAELGTMSRLAMVDGLTSLGNRRRLDGDLETTLANATSGDAMLGFAMIDVDHFKTYNDTHGHSAGDDVLRKVATTIARSVRDGDIVYRYGGEEFSMLLPGATPDEATAVAERVRAAIEDHVFPGEDQQPGGRLTVSIGVATLGEDVSDNIRERADQALYQAKENGRNQVAFG
ncbi:MAG: GGDEF domain-containing protein [Actinomycetota bacterium]